MCPYVSPCLHAVDGKSGGRGDKEFTVTRIPCRLPVLPAGIQNLSPSRGSLIFPAFSRWRAGDAIGTMHGDRVEISDRTMGSVLIVVATPILQLFAGIRKAHEPVRIQAFRPELAVEGFDEPVVGRFSRP